MLTEIFIYAIVYAIIANVYISILSKEPILNWWFRFGLRFEDRFFWKPLFGCEKCFSGQLAFWIYLFNWINSETYFKPFKTFLNFFFVEYQFSEFNVMALILSVSTSVLFAFILSIIIIKLKQWK